MSKLNFLFIYPPFCYPASPYISTFLLSTILKNNGYSASCMDFNAELYDKIILKQNMLKQHFNILKKNIELLDKKQYEFSDNTEKELIYKVYPFLKKFIETKEQDIVQTINNIERNAQTLKSKKEFYNIDKLTIATAQVRDAANLFCYTYFISEALNRKIGHKFATLDYYVKNKKLNPFYSFFEEYIKSGFFDKYTHILISQPFELQTFASFTLGYLLKKMTNKTVCIGGNYISRIKDSLTKQQKIYTEYFDNIIFGLGEDSIVQYAQYSDNKISQSEVAGLSYIENCEIRSNSVQTFLQDINKRTKISFDNVEYKKYLIPEVVIPLQVSKGCPWGKCTFCVFHSGKTRFQIANPQLVVDEIKYYNKKYGIKNFEFVDESLTPKYYYEVAKEIIRQKLRINYYGFARFDNNFTKEILDTMYKSGFKIFEWGYETPSKRIMEIYNKGIDIDKRHDILKRASDSGIWNHCLSIVNIPFETKEEEEADLDIYEKNQDIIHSRLISPLQIFKNTKMKEYIVNNNVIELSDDGDLSIGYSLNWKDTKFQKSDIIKKKEQNLYSIYKKKAWTTLIDTVDEYLLIYLAKYGKDVVLDMKINSVQELFYV